MAKRLSAPQTSTAAPAYAHDVAFSFLSLDEQIATDLNEQLKPHLTTFLYTEHLKEMLGPDGYTKYGHVFRSDARVVVIVYRDGWGARGFTAIEAGAIEQRVHAEGLGFLFVVTAPASTPPTLLPWIPPSFVYCALPVFSIEAAAASIRDHVGRAGATPKIETAADVARRQAQERARAERKRQFRYTRAYEAACQQLPQLYAALNEIAGNSAGEIDPPRWTRPRQQFTISTHRSAYPQLCFSLTGSSGSDREHELIVAHFERDSMMYDQHDPPEYSRYQIAISGHDGDQPGWRPLDFSTAPLMSDAAVADREIKELLEMRRRYDESDE